MSRSPYYSTRPPSAEVASEMAPVERQPALATRRGGHYGTQEHTKKARARSHSNIAVSKQSIKQVLWAYFVPISIALIYTIPPPHGRACVMDVP